MNEVFDALSDIHRRRLLVALLDHEPEGDDWLPLPDGVTWGKIEEETLRTELHHNHLPRLEQAGFVTWNQESREVARGPQFERVRPVLELLDDHDEELPGTVV